MAARENRDAISNAPEPFSVATAFRTAVATGPPLSVQQFVALLERSQLVPPRQLEAMRTRALADGQLTAREFAQSLVEAGHLTKWQAERLLARKAGFNVGKYRLIDRIGAGGMAVVLKGQQIGMNRTVAIKVLARTLLRRQEAVKRFFREIEAASALDHPNIVRALDSNCIDGVPFLVMEYVEGRDLHSLVSQRGPLPVPWACEFIRQAALGLQHAYEREVIHRDIKPANLLVTRKGHEDNLVIKILDFGLARFSSETPDAGLTSANQIFGTVDFIAPEQARSARTADTRADIFSLGCTLYFLLTARVPFRGETAMEKLTARITEGPVPIDTLRPDIPDALNAVLMRMMAQEPGDRFQSPAAVAAALAPFCRPTSDAAETSVLARRGDDRPGSSESELALEKFLSHLDPGSGETPASEEDDESAPRALPVVAVIAMIAMLAALLAIGWWMFGPRAGHSTPSPPAPASSSKSADGAAILPTARLSLPAWPGEAPGLVMAWNKTMGQHVSGLIPSAWALAETGKTARTPDGSLLLAASTAHIQGPEDMLARACQQSGEFSVEVALDPASASARAARIVAFATQRSTNFALLQSNENLVARITTSMPGAGKRSSDVELCRLTPGRLRHVVVSYRDGQTVCYLDGERVAERDDVRGALADWSADELILGDDLTETGGWSGRIEAVAFYSRFLTAKDARRQFELGQ